MFVGATLTEAHGNVLKAAGLTAALFPLAYLFLIVPAMALAFVDWLLAELPVRFPVVCVVGFFGTAMIFATGSDSEQVSVFRNCGSGADRDLLVAGEYEMGAGGVNRGGDGEEDYESGNRREACGVTKPESR